MDSKKVVIILGSSGQLGKEFSNSKNLKRVGLTGYGIEIVKTTKY